MLINVPAGQNVGLFLHKQGTGDELGRSRGCWPWQSLLAGDDAILKAPTRALEELGKVLRPG